MKKFAYILTLAVVALASCTSTKEASINEAANYSWEAFCITNGYAVNNTSAEVENEYLDTWRGSVAEENALLAAGYKPF